MSTLELLHLTKTYPNGERAVRDLDLTIADGELFVLVGPSGCGKSTVLRLIAGLEDVTGGEVRIDGVTVNDVRTSDRDVAMAFQSYALYPHMTVEENIGFALKAAHIHATTAASKVRDVAELLHVADVLDRRPAQLSGGQRQRSALGRAIVRAPRLLLLDEPMSNLDTKLRSETRAAICRIQRRLGVTTVCVTHDQVEAMAMGDRIGVMREGRIVQLGTPLDLYEMPDDLFVAQFMGSPSMNVLLATVVDEGDRLAFRVGAQVVPLDAAGEARLPDVRRLIGRDVGLGVRPTDLHLDERGPLVVSVASTERLGPDQLVHATIHARRVTAVAERVVIGGADVSPIVVATRSGDELDRWQPLVLGVDTRQLHVFDLSTGLALVRRPDGAADG